MALPSIVAKVTGSDASNTLASVVTAPTNIAGDVIYIGISSDASSQTFTGPAGFSAVYSNVGVSGNTAGFSLFRKTSTGAEPSTYTVTLGSSEKQTWVAWSVRNDGGIDSTGTNATGSSATASIPAVTTTQNDCLVFAMVIVDGSTGLGALPTGYDSVDYVNIITSSATGLSWFHLDKTTAGTVAGQNVALGASEQWLGISFAIKSAGGGGGAASITFDPLTVTATGQIDTSGEANITLGALTVAASNDPGIQGSANITLGDLTVTATGTGVLPSPFVVDRINNASSANTTTVTVVTPANIVGDIIYIAISSDAPSQTFSLPGFSVLYNNVGTFGNTSTFALFYKPSSGAEPSTYTITLSVAERQAWVAWSVRGDGGIDVVGTNATGDSATATIPAVTTISNNTLVFGIIIVDGSGHLNALPTGYSADYVHMATASATGFGWFHLDKAAAGLVASQTVALNVSEQWLGVSFAIKPSGSANTGTANITLGALTVTATAGADNVGTANITLGALTVSASSYTPDARFRQAIAVPDADPPPMATRFYISIENATGVKLGGGPLITGIKWSYKQKLSQAGEWSLEVPLAEPRATFAGLKRRVHCYVRRGGRSVWLGGGIIESLNFGLSDQGVSILKLSGPDLLRELVGTTVKFEVSALDAAPRAQRIIANIFAAVPTWAVTIPVGLPEITARFVHESVLNALIATTAKVGAFFWMEPYTVAPRRITIATTPVASSIVATNLADPLAAERNPSLCLISNIEKTESSWDATNRLIVYGAGEGQARLTLAMATLWPNGAPITASYAYDDPYGRSHLFVFDKTTNTITDVLAVTEYGQSEQAAAFKEIAPITDNTLDMVAAANTLVVAAVNQLVLSSFPTVTYQLSVAALRAVVHPGMQIRVVARKVRDDSTYINVDERLIIQEVAYEIDEKGERVTGLTVATTWKPEKTGATILSEQIQKLTALEAHPQTNNNTNTISYREDVDAGYGATFPFWLSRGTQLVNSITLRYKLEPLRSTVKTIGGTATGTVDVPPHSHQADIPDHHHSVDHQHYLTFQSASGGKAVEVFSGGGSPDFGSLGHTGGGGTINVYTNTDSSVTSETDGGSARTTEDGGGQTGLTVDISSALTAQYGVYVDPIAPYAVTDLIWTANGATITDAPVALADGWYEVDITRYLVDLSNSRPLTPSNAIAVAVKPLSYADKRVRVTTQIELRTTIQTLAVV